jgi:AcrR family transcriptional regulator
MAPQARKLTQRDRLIAGMVEALNRHGWTGATLAAIVAPAKVSRPTFYEYFAGREDCLRASIERVQDELHECVSDALADVEEAQAAPATVRALVQYASAKPERARFLMAAAMAGGPDALDARDQGIARLATTLAGAQAGAGAEVQVADLPGEIMIASVYRLLGVRLRRGEATISRLTDELLAWVAAYERPAEERRWQALSPHAAPAPSAHVPLEPIQQMPSVLPRGRPVIPEDQIIENQRLRILYATARIAESKGYTATKVSDITKFARVDGKLFYRLFSDKQEAFATVHELGFQQVMDVTSKAYFSVTGWPQRCWEGGRALTQLLDANPLVANVGFVEAYAAGPAAVQRIEDSHTAFMFFLQEGLVYEGALTPPSRTAMEAIIASIFVIIYQQARAGDELALAGLLGDIAHLWLTPFLGTAQTDAFIEQQLRPAKPGRKQARKQRAR